MPATSPEAIKRKADNRKSKKDIMREDKISKLGGTTISVEYGVPLCEDIRKERTEYLYDLMYPNRNAEKSSRGRPRKYASDAEARDARLAKARERYRERRNADPAEYVTKTGAEAHRGTPWYSMYFGAKSRAKKQGLPFNIDCAYLASIWAETCPVFGTTLSTEGSTMTDNSPTLDKIIPENGYVKGNVAIISNRANRIKNDATVEEVGKVYSWLRKTLA